ncbi:MAG: type II secretion system minor pseudopilin GspJ [Gammaproteobacteria bacterium]|nr:type II secretion system minor pseudopilin GspJ [Gammaproteobacteria bacterium]MBU1414874.1 type II secretion system minor pseudopilin GspJ [Gammaproteobacteria bacterium]
MTLIEMLVALAIFAVLGVMGYRAAAIAMESRDRISAEMDRWRDIANFVQVLELDLTQYVDPPRRIVAGRLLPAPSFVLASADGLVEFSFPKLDGGGGSVRRRGYRFDGKQILQLRWPGVDMESGPDLHVILENVVALRCTVVGADGQRHAVWPTDKSGLAVTPAAVDIELEVSDVGTIHRLYAVH